MKRTKTIFFIVIVCSLFFLTGKVDAQTYSFSLDKMTVDVYWEEDGTLSVDYLFIFTNDVFASPIDYIDVGLPNSHYNIQNIYAEVNGHPLTDISESPYVKPGVAIGLGTYAIQPGSMAQVWVSIMGIERVLYTDSEDQNYASAVFSPTWFGSEFVHGKTDMTVTYHLPPGIKPEEPKWHEAPPGFPQNPITGLDGQGRIIYIWNNPNANAFTQYKFGASFPKSYVPEAAIVRPNPFEWIKNINLECVIPILCFTIFIVIIAISIIANQRRKLQYLPPKIAIEGHGIKRGLTAVEAAILMDKPVDVILTMILFSLLKKNAVKVLQQDPLKIEKTEPIPEDLRDYEKEFIEAFSHEDSAMRKKALQETMINLVKSVSQKMKGFSRKETIAYYQDIVNRAWKQVEAADTPEVKSQAYEEVMEWTMLDREYERKTKDVFQSGPVYAPVWWPRYVPSYRGAASAQPTSAAPSAAPSSRTMPKLPGSDFAASIVNGVQNVATNVIGNITEFTNGITKVTNPPPVTYTQTRSGGYRSSGSRSCACACACACAGCACACAGGGR